jgi:hypothetical protein
MHKYFLALSLLGLDPAAFYEKSEINVHLSAFLDIIASQEGSSDHITLRRHLVDFSFLRRATDGAVYLISAERIDEVLPRNARDIDAKALFRGVAVERLRRRREHSNQGLSAGRLPSAKPPAILPTTHRYLKKRVNDLYR